ncbi:hypothetical protein CU098_006846, partial [Rhizopus stolonifer]
GDSVPKESIIYKKAANTENESTIVDKIDLRVRYLSSGGEVVNSLCVEFAKNTSNDKYFADHWEVLREAKGGMRNKRHLDDPESPNSKRPQMTTLPSILNYFKNYYTYQAFDSKDLLLLLNCNTSETAKKKEPKNQMNDIIDVKNVKDEVRKFVSCLLIDDLKCLSDSNADLYWTEKKSMAALMTSSHKQLQVYHEVSSGMMDQALHSVQRVDQPVIAENTSPSPTSSLETESLLANIWSIWSDVLYDMLTDNHDDKDIHEYSLEYLGIIILGNHIGNKQSRQLYPKELVSKTNKAIQMSVVDVFQKFLLFYAPLFESLAVSLDECHTLLLKNSLKVKKTADPGLQFTFDFFMIFVTQILNKRDVLSKQESIYNYRAIFRFFDAVVSATPSCTFFPGETRLQAINKELERLEMSTKSYYNADGVILDSDTGLELCLLETSGPFGLIDFKAEFMGLANLFWKLKVRKTQKVLLDDSKSSLNEIKASHTKNETAYCNGHINNLPTLDQYLVESAEVKLSSRISQTSDIYVSSSPIRPDSP